MQETHIGSRIRDRRIEMGMKQAELAKYAGISASYLNLIEYNRRKIAGKLLVDIADHLQLTPEALTDGTDPKLLAQIRVSAIEAGQSIEDEQISAFAGRYPAWANVVAQQSQQIGALQSQIQTLNDRITHDPQLADSLHDVITSITSIRSSASILVSGEPLDADWQSRFNTNVYNDAVRLAAQSEALIKFLEAPQAYNHSHQSAQDEADTWMAATDHHVAALENGKSVSAVLKAADMSTSAARSALETRLRSYAADVAALPYALLDKAARAAKSNDYNPLLIAEACGVAMPVVLRRLAALRSGEGHPAISLAVCDASASITMIKQVAGFPMQRNREGCPLWPLYSAFSRPDQPIRTLVEMPGDAADRFLCYAIATRQGAAHFDAPPALQSTMIAIADPSQNRSEAVPVGVSCTLCPRQNCASRRA